MVSINRVILSGRLVRKPEIRNNGTAVAKYCLAVDRRFKRDGEPTADFINCTVFGKAAEFAEKYLDKGTKLIVSGRIQTGSYTNKDGNKVNTFDIIVDEQEFAENKSTKESITSSSRETNAAISGDTSFTPIDDTELEDTPF